MANSDKSAKLQKSIMSAEDTIDGLNAERAQFERDLEVLRQTRARSSRERVTFAEGLGQRRSAIASIGAINNVQQAQHYKIAMSEAFGSSFESGVFRAFDNLNADLDSRIAEAERRLQGISAEISKTQDRIDQAQNELRAEAARQQAESQTR